MKACQMLLENLSVLHSTLDAARPELERLRMEPKDLFLLQLVEAHPNPAALARAMVVPPSTVTFLIKRAQAAGHLKRDTVPDDLRKFRLTITPAGRRAKERGERAIEHAFGERLRRLSSAERATFEDVLRTLAE